MDQRVSQKDIARLLNVDKSTVSLALRNDPSISTATRKKVNELAERLGYRPDPASSFLALRRWSGKHKPSGNVIAYIVDGRMPDYAIHRRFLAAARQRAQLRGYLLQTFNLADYKTLEAATRVLHNRGIRGLLAPQFSFIEGPGILETTLQRCTVVGLDIGTQAVPFHIVAPDTFQATRVVWQQVIERGYERIGGAVLSHHPRAFDDATRLGASIASQREWIPPQHHLPLLESHHQDRDSFYRWLDANQPDVVIGFISRVYNWIITSGRRVPEDIAFAALGVIVDESPQISGAPLPDNQIGAVGIDTLIAAMHADEWGIPNLQRKLLIEPTWHEGRTLPLKARPSSRRPKLSG